MIDRVRLVSHMELKEKIEDGIAVISLTGSLHSETDALQLRETMNALVQKRHVNVILDISRLTYINSWGLGLLVALLAMLRRSGGDLRLAELGPKIHNLFIVTQLTKVFQTYATIDLALRSYRSAHQ